LTDDNLGGAVRICRLVDGMPLGIQLAASWVTVLSVQEIASELARSLDLLATERRDVPARQRSMRATLDHTWLLLTERQRELLRGLSIFRGGCTREAAQEVTGASLHELMELVDRSLLQPSLVGRYEMHELSRQYAREKLDASECAATAAHDRHCAYYCAALERWGEELKGPRQQRPIAEIRAESWNVHAAWDWAAEHGQVAQLDQAIDGLGWFYDRHHPNLTEAEALFGEAAEAPWAQEALASSATPDAVEAVDCPVASQNALSRQRVLAKVLAWQAYFGILLSPLKPPEELLRRSLARLEQPSSAGQDTRLEKAWALEVMGESAGELEEAKQLLEQSLALYQALDDRFMAAVVLFRLCITAVQSADYKDAERHAEQALALRRELGDLHGIGNLLMFWGWSLLDHGELDEGERVLREASAVMQKLGDSSNVAHSLELLAVIQYRHGRFAEARPVLEESLSISEDLGLDIKIVWRHYSLVETDLHRGRYDEARDQGELGLTRARDTGNHLACGAYLVLLGAVAVGEGAYTEAEKRLHESVAILREGRDFSISTPHPIVQQGMTLAT
jgi:tetratricopeptide (TPR) repeat protein